jgi:hypothetical protein
VPDRAEVDVVDVGHRNPLGDRSPRTIDHRP